uniref:Uncharacterized protein n=1 Tax=Pygocentrus nattereri TaxID=42514 RepID=A0A3B4D541_PYGNA
MAKFLCLVQFCLILTLCSVSSVFSCRWNYRKFRHYHGNCLTLLREMVNSENGNIFDADWFAHHTNSQPVKQIWLFIQTLEEISSLLTEADPVPWNKEQLNNFLNMLDYETEELHSCVSAPLLFLTVLTFLLSKTAQLKEQWIKQCFGKSKTIPSLFRLNRLNFSESFSEEGKASPNF